LKIRWHVEYLMPARSTCEHSGQMSAADWGANGENAAYHHQNGNNSQIGQ
jgi:hypothetical protein